MSDPHDIADGETLLLPFPGQSFRLRLGMSSITEEQWLQIDGNYHRDLAEKERWLAEQHFEVVAMMPSGEGDAPSAELLEMVRDNIARFHPTVEVSAEGVHQIQTARGMHPVEVAARMVQDDLLVMTPSPDGYVLTAGVLCFPTRWRLRDKLGLPMSAIHAPVPGYADAIGALSDQAMERLSVDRPMVRANWSLMADPEYHQPVRAFRRDVSADITADNAGDLLYLRVERQSLRRLPSTGAIVFGVRLHVWPLMLIADQPAVCARLAAHVRSMPEPFAQYKNIPFLAPAVLGWLDARSVASQR